MSYCANALTYTEKNGKDNEKITISDESIHIRKTEEKHKNSSNISRDYQLKV